MEPLQDLRAFVAIVDHGSQSAAARQLGRSVQSISRSLGELERSLGVQLIRRTTRRSSTTEIGRGYYRRVQAALAEPAARRLGALRLVVLGAPAYLERHGRPQRPEDLAAHQCLVRTTHGNDAEWPFTVDGRLQRVKVSGRFRADSTSALYAAVTAGMGLFFTPLWQIRHLLDSGQAELVLTEFEAPPIPARGARQLRAREAVRRLRGRAPAAALSGVRPGLSPRTGPRVARDCQRAR